MSITQFKRLFEPFKLGDMLLKNRIVMAPMGTGYVAEGGYVNQRYIDYYEARAKGGVGLIITGATAPSMQCQRSPFQLSIGDDKSMTGFKNLVDTVHKYGTKIALQLVHSSWEIRSGEAIQVAPSPIVVPAFLVGISGKTPHELTVGEIGNIVGWFADGARRAKEAGFDGVEIHGAHNYLIALFLSSAANKRQDKYGGTIQNKARFLIEILQEMRKAVGADYPIWIRINAREYGIEGGITVEEAKGVAREAVVAGAQAIHVSAYGVGSYVTKAPMTDTPGFLIPLAEEIKKVVHVPVIAVGRLDPELGEQVLEEGKADLIAVGRRLMADPELPNKAARGRLNEVNPCIACMECNERPRKPGEGTSCTVNAVMGHEGEYMIRPVEKAKRIVVVGGGPAGMEVAKVAALRGHEVILLEKETRLGGQLNIASLIPYKGDIANWVSYEINELAKVGVEIKLSMEATIELIKENRPDTVVVAIGGLPIVPEISGISKPNVVTAQDVLFGNVTVGQDVVIIGGGMVGCETAYYLAERGSKVTIIEIQKRMATDMGLMVRRRLMDGLRAKKVIMMTNTTCEEITDRKALVVTSDGKEESLKADTIVIASGYQKNDRLAKALEGEVPEVYCIGDATQPQRIMEAIHDGYRVGLSV